MDETKGMERRKRSTSMEDETIERVERINGEQIGRDRSEAGSAIQQLAQSKSRPN